MKTAPISDLLPAARPSNAVKTREIRKEQHGNGHMHRNNASKSDQKGDAEVAKVVRGSDRKADRTETSQFDAGTDFEGVIADITHPAIQAAMDQGQNSQAPQLASNALFPPSEFLSAGALLNKVAQPQEQNDRSRTVTRGPSVESKLAPDEGEAPARSFSISENRGRFQFDALTASVSALGWNGPKFSAPAAAADKISVHQLTQETGIDAEATVTASQTYSAPKAMPMVFQMMDRQAQDKGNAVTGNVRTVGPIAPNSEIVADEPVETGLSAPFTLEVDSKTQPDERRSMHREGGERSEGGASSRGPNLARAGAVEPKILAGNDAAVSTPAIASPARQLGSGIIDALGADVSGQTDYVGLFADRPTAPTGNVVRSLELALNPAELGHVRVRMNLSGSELTLEIEAAKSETARIITNDRSGLDKNLRDAGLDLASMKVSVSPTDVGLQASANATSTAPASQQMPQGSSSSGQGASMSFGGQAQDQRRQAQSTQNSNTPNASGQHSTDASAAQGRASDRALYI